MDYLRPYPTDELNFPINPEELDFHETELDPDNPYSKNNHHKAYSRRAMGRLLITETYRNLESMQTMMFKDVHQELHDRYGPPKVPLYRHLMERIEAAHDQQEQMKIYDPSQKKYLHLPITQIHIKQLHMEYNGLEKDLSLVA